MCGPLFRDALLPCIHVHCNDVYCALFFYNIIIPNPETSFNLRPLQSALRIVLRKRGSSSVCVPRSLASVVYPNELYVSASASLIGWFHWKLICFSIISSLAFLFEANGALSTFLVETCFYRFVKNDETTFNRDGAAVCKVLPLH